MPSGQDYQEIVEKLIVENEKLKKRIERVEAINDIQRLMGEYYNTHVANPNEPINHFNQWIYFADREDTTYEVANFGLLKGFKNVQFFFREKRGGMEKQTGIMFEHDLCSPQIVVADDGETARGVWTSPGHETLFGHPEWAWGRVAADFIKIDGCWKIWHYHWYRLFRCPFDTPWTNYDQQSVSKPIPKERVIEFGGDPDNVFPTTYFHPYSPDTYVECIPRTPQPYATWTDDRLPV
jgi:hypothetical protein